MLIDAMRYSILSGKIFKYSVVLSKKKKHENSAMLGIFTFTYRRYNDNIISIGIKFDETSRSYSKI